MYKLFIQGDGYSLQLNVEIPVFGLTVGETKKLFESAGFAPKEAEAQALSCCSSVEAHFRFMGITFLNILTSPLGRIPGLLERLTADLTKINALTKED
jgi:hypothetical protein